MCCKFVLKNIQLTLSKHFESFRSLLGWTIGHLRQSSQISNWHITWLCLSDRGTTNASYPRCRCSKREIGGQLTLVATRNLIWVACVWQILIIMLQYLVSLRRIYSLQPSPSQELEVTKYKKRMKVFIRKHFACERRTYDMCVWLPCFNYINLCFFV